MESRRSARSFLLSDTLYLGYFPKAHNQVKSKTKLPQKSNAITEKEKKPILSNIY